MTKSPQRPTKAVGYVRVSSQEQAQSGLSMEEQEREIRARAAQLGLELVGVFVDAGVSGGKSMDEREGLSEALAALPRGGVLIISKRDRLGRDYVEVGLIERAVTKRRGKIVSCSPGEQGFAGDDPTSVLMRGILDLFAHFERLMGKVRMRAAARARKARGEPAGFVEYGMRVNADGKLEKDTREQATITAVLSMRCFDGMTQRKIVNELQIRGHLSRSGTPLGLSQVQRILKRAEESP